MDYNVYIACLVPIETEGTNYDACEVLGVFDTSEDAHEFVRKWILVRKECIIQDEQSGIFVVTDQFEEPVKTLWVAEVSMLPINVDIEVQTAQIF